MSAVRQSAPSGTSHRGVPRPGLRLLVTGSIHYTIKIASAVSRRRRKSKIVHAQRPDQIPPRAFHASPSAVPAQAGTQSPTRRAVREPPLIRHSRALPRHSRGAHLISADYADGRMRYPAPGIPRSVVVLLGFAKRTGRQEIPRSIVAMTLNIALVGAGGMGMRHATGYIELRKYFDDVRMVAVCDPHVDSAEAVASVIAGATPERPEVFASLADAVDAVGLDAVDIVTSTPAHHVLAIEAMRAGLHVMVEKPMGLTLTACRMMQSVEQETGKVLSISENFRRDPMNRLAKSLIDAGGSGAIGRPYFAVDFSIGSAHRGVMHSTVWRAKKDQAGGVVLDAGVHNADLLLYLMGPAVRVYAETDVNDPERIMRPMSDQAPGLAAMYTHRREPDSNPLSPGERVRVRVGDIIEQDAVDTAFATIRFASGAAGQLIITDASHGYSLGDSVVVGSEGTLYRPPSRRGTGPRIVRADGTSVEGDALLDLVPDFEIDDVTSTLWDGERRMSSYEMDFRKIDAKIIAIEYMDLARSVADGGSPEVGSNEGMAALALAYGVMESGETNQAVSIDDVLSGAVSGFQDDIDRAAGIVEC